MKLVQYRDQHMSDYIWFWVNEFEYPISPSFESEEEAKNWSKEDTWDNWKPIKEFV